MFECIKNLFGAGQELPDLKEEQLKVEEFNIKVEQEMMQTYCPFTDSGKCKGRHCIHFKHGYSFVIDTGHLLSVKPKCKLWGSC